jgi:predicted Zn-dependent protease
MHLIESIRPLRSYPFLRDPDIEGYIRQIARRIAASHDDYESILPIHVLDCPKEVNAYVVPQRGLYVCTGLLMCAEDEAEIGGVLGHEMVHRKQNRHTSYRPFTHISRNADWRAHLASSIIDGIYIGISHRLLWREELEADRLSLDYLHRAGYYPRAFEALLMKVQRIGRNHPAHVATWLSTHPPIEKRLVHIRGHLRDLPEKASYTGAEIYRKRMEKLEQRASL